MAIERRQCWVCEVCGWAWMITGDTPPLQCVSVRCRSRRWHASASPGKTSPVAPPPSMADDARPDAGRKTATRKAPQPDAASPRQLASVAPIQPRIPRVRSDESDIAQALLPSAAPALARLADAVALPRKVGEMCPHGFSSWLVCAACNPRTH